MWLAKMKIHLLEAKPINSDYSATPIELYVA
jgi:hypothetical protein